MIDLRQLEIRRSEFCLQGISLNVPQGAYASFVGPSGSGKTTILECMAGLLVPSAGKVFLNGVDVTAMAPAARRIGYVPQDLALFSSMTVQQNLAFGLRKRAVSVADANDRVDEVAKQLQLTKVVQNRADELSRGQAQRVALGRALVMQPEILIMDEPLSSLDAKTMTLVLDALKQFHDQCRSTVLHVTHQEDHLSGLCTRRCQLSNGSVVCENC